MASTHHPTPPIGTCPPAVVIRPEFEGKPKLLTDCQNEGEWDRLNDWLDTQPGLLELLDLAVDLRDAAEAA